jgi:flavodoxin
MAKALVVYDSVFGNTEKVARAIGDALGARVLRVTAVEPGKFEGIELLIVGSPTRAFSPTKGTKAFLKRIPAGGLEGVAVAAFDTRMDPKDVGSGIYTLFARLFGYAAGPIAKRLQKKGGRLLVRPEGFFVTASEGPLRDNELERAAAWAAPLVEST